MLTHPTPRAAPALPGLPVGIVAPSDPLSLHQLLMKCPAPQTSPAGTTSPLTPTHVPPPGALGSSLAKHSKAGTRAWCSYCNAALQQLPHSTNILCQHNPVNLGRAKFKFYLVSFKREKLEGRKRISACKGSKNKVSSEVRDWGGFAVSQSSIEL